MSRTDEELMMLVLSERTVLMSDEEDESVYSMCVTDNMSTGRYNHGGIIQTGESSLSTQQL